MTAINSKMNINNGKMVNATQLAQAIAQWLIINEKNKVIIGYNNNKSSQKVAEAMVKVFGAAKLKVNYATAPVKDEMLTKGIIMTKSHIGIMINHKSSVATFKSLLLRGEDGELLPANTLQAIQNLMYAAPIEPHLNLEEMMENGLLNHIDLKILCDVVDEM